MNVRLDRVRFRPGARATIGLDARNPAAGTTVELYVGIVLPDGGSAAFVGPVGLGDPQRAAQLARWAALGKQLISAPLGKQPIVVCMAADPADPDHTRPSVASTASAR